MKGGSRPTHHQHLTVDLAEKLDFLVKPAAFGENNHTVSTVETSMAWIFLTDKFAYKLKKPVYQPHQNYSTIDARRLDTEAELQLNKFFAPDVYLGVLPLCVNSQAEMNLNGDGYPSDWLLKMRRLPSAKMLDHRFEKQTFTAQHATLIAQHLAAIYESRSPVAISFREYRARFHRDIDFTCRLLSQEATLITAIRELYAHQNQFVAQQGHYLDECLRANRVMDCHGDLRPEHICVQEKICIIDCLQFSRDYRLMDFFDDAAFLALECERLGQSAFGNDFLGALAKLTGELPAPALLHFYQSFRAGIRARLAFLHISRSDDHDRHKWLTKTRRYLDLSLEHIKRALT